MLFNLCINMAFLTLFSNLLSIHWLISGGKRTFICGFPVEKRPPKVHNQ